MSLNWDAQDVSDWDKFTTQEKDSAIWYTMFVDMSHITEDNYEEFADRVRVHDALFTQFPPANGARELGNPEYVKRLIGLRTNVSNTPFRKWFSTQYKHLESERQRNKS